MPLSDFGEVFGYGGLYDKFFTDNLDKLVDTSQRPWSLASRVGRSRRRACWRSSNGRSAFARCFSAPGSKTPELEFTVKLSKLDADGDAVRTSTSTVSVFDVKPGAESDGR